MHSISEYLLGHPQKPRCFQLVSSTFKDRFPCSISLSLTIPFPFFCQQRRLTTNPNTQKLHLVFHLSLMTAMSSSLILPSLRSTSHRFLSLSSSATTLSSSPILEDIAALSSPPPTPTHIPTFTTYQSTHSTTKFNPGLPLDLNFLSRTHMNKSGLERRAGELGGRRCVKKNAQSAWLLRAINCIDLTTLSGDDTTGNVNRLCAKARRPIRDDILAKLGVKVSKEWVREL